MPDPPASAESQPAQPETFLTFEQTMERLSLSRAQVYRKVKDGSLKAKKEDHVLTFAESDLQKYQTGETARQAAFREAAVHWLERLAARLAEQGETDLPDLAEKTDDEHTAELTRRILLDAVLSGVQDVYLDPLFQGDRLLYRFEGVLREIGRMDTPLSGPLKASFKSLAPLPPADPAHVSRALFQHIHKDRTFQLQMTVVPTLLGEQVHVHALDPPVEPGLNTAGYTPDQVAALRALLTGRPGLFLAAGALDPAADRHRLALATELSAAGRLVVSLEHHIQYRSELLVQLEVGKEGGPPFSDLWRTALRMSPEVLLVDEVADAETARALLEGVSAGAVVVAQVRASGSVEALLGLLGLELDPVDLAHALLGVVERASLRRLCPYCSTSRTSTEEEARLLDLPPGAQIREKQGCERCGDGILGRRMVYGLLPADGALIAGLCAPDPTSRSLDPLRSRSPLSLAPAVRATLLAGEIPLDDANPFLLQTPHPSDST